MRSKIRIIYLCLSIFLFFKCGAQSFSVGVRNAIGISPIPTHSTLTVGGLVTEIRPTIHLAKNITLQYLIANKFGVESGIQAILYSYARKNDTFIFSNDIWVQNFQVPLLFVFKTDHQYNAFRHFKFLAGTSVDWVVGDGITGQRGWLKNMIAGFRIGNSNFRYGRIEYGLEYQYSLSRYTVLTSDYKYPNVIINSRLSLLSINLICFFIDKNSRIADKGL